MLVETGIARGRKLTSYESIKTDLKNAGARSFVELQTTGHPPDHPATFAEANYLKAIYLKF